MQRETSICRRPHEVKTHWVALAKSIFVQRVPGCRSGMFPSAQERPFPGRPWIQINRWNFRSGEFLDHLAQDIRPYFILFFCMSSFYLYKAFCVVLNPGFYSSLLLPFQLLGFWEELWKQKQQDEQHKILERKRTSEEYSSNVPHMQVQGLVIGNFHQFR